MELRGTRVVCERHRGTRGKLSMSEAFQRGCGRKPAIVDLLAFPLSTLLVLESLDHSARTTCSRRPDEATMPRGRKADLSLPPSRSRDTQRRFRQKKADYVLSRSPFPFLFASLP